MIAKEFKLKIDNDNLEKRILDNYSVIGEDNRLTGLKKINIFIGANNTGKSRFLREVFRSHSENFLFYNNIHSQLNEIFETLAPKFKNLFYMADLEKLIRQNLPEFEQRFNAFYKKLTETKGQRFSTNNISDLDVENAIKIEMQKLKIFNEIPISDKIKRRHIYIPILRGLRQLDLDNNEDFYLNITNKEYNFNINENEKYRVFSGLSIYEDIKKKLLGSQSQRIFIKDFEKFLSKSFFEGRELTLTPNYEEAILSINIEGDDDRKIFDLGDGMQAILINTFKAFEHKNENLVLCIEEPEMMMHPSFQRVLIETFITKFEKLQVFLTTHSNHFLDLAYDYPNDVAIFAFEEPKTDIRNPRFNIRNVGVNAKILDLLGVRNSSVFLSNCVIWTEGVTDRMLLRKLLEINKCAFKEDFHYSFAEYGGSNLENFEFNENGDSNGVTIAALSKRNFLIADNDNIKCEDNKNHESSILKRREKIKNILGEVNFFDEHLEIENLIPYKVWRQVIESIFKEKPDKGICLKPFAETKSEGFDKELNEKKIGVLLKEYLIELKDKEFDYFKKDNIKCLGLPKKEVMGYVVKAIDELKVPMNEFPEKAKGLIESITKFIESANKKP